MRMMTEVRRHRADEGFTVLELSIAMALSLVIMGSILGILVSQTNAEKRVSTFADNQEILRQAVIQMQRDIRSSEPLRALTSSPAYALRIDLHVYDDITSPAPRPIRWRVDTTTDELLREEVDANGNVVAVSHRVTGIVNDADNPLFSFFPPGGVAYQLVPHPVTGDQALAADIAQCTVRIHVNLVGAPTPGPEPAVLASDAQLRNRLPGGQGCNNGVIL